MSAAPGRSQASSHRSPQGEGSPVSQPADRIAWMRISSCVLPLWADASAGRSGLSTQAIGVFDVALWDRKARRANLSLAKLLGVHRGSVRCYNTSGGFLHTPIDQLKVNAAASVACGIGGIKLKVGQPDGRMPVPTRPGLGLSLSEQARGWTRERAEVCRRV